MVSEEMIVAGERYLASLPDGLDINAGECLKSLYLAMSQASPIEDDGLIQGLRTHAYDDCNGEELPTHIANIAADRIISQSQSIRVMREALEWWEAQATSWLEGRAPTAIPGWMRPAIEKGRSALGASGHD